MPGAGWKRKAKIWRAQTEAVIHRPYDLAMQRMVQIFSLSPFMLTSNMRPCLKAANTAIDSFVTQHHRHATNSRQEYVLRTTAASLYAGGADTVSFFFYN